MSHFRSTRANYISIYFIYPATKQQIILLFFCKYFVNNKSNVARYLLFYVNIYLLVMFFSHKLFKSPDELNNREQFK